jgi:hypothetical protein
MLFMGGILAGHLANRKKANPLTSERGQMILEKNCAVDIRREWLKETV